MATCTRVSNWFSLMITCRRLASGIVRAFVRCHLHMRRSKSASPSLEMEIVRVRNVNVGVESKSSTPVLFVRAYASIRTDFAVMILRTRAPARVTALLQTSATTLRNPARHGAATRFMTSTPSRRLHGVPSLGRYDNQYKAEGIDGLYTPEAFDFAWTKYQGHMVNRLNHVLAGESAVAVSRPASRLADQFLLL